VIVATPFVIPVTTPEAASTAAIPGALLLQMPPEVPLVIKPMEDPTQTDDPPDKLLIIPASCTVIFADPLAVPQEVVTVYVMVTVPAVTPVTTPEPAFTVATFTSLLLQLPPPVLLVNAVDKPLQILDAPLTVIPPGTGFTVTTWVALATPQPLFGSA
jgi:hypothetical protein